MLLNTVLELFLEYNEYVIVFKIYDIKLYIENIYGMYY